MPRTFAPVFSFTMLASSAARPPSLRVAKAVRRAGLGLGDKAAIGIVDALGYGDHTAAGLLVDALDVGKERVHVEISLGQVDEVGTRAVLRCERGGGSQPTGVAAMISTMQIMPVS